LTTLLAAKPPAIKMVTQMRITLRRWAKIALLSELEKLFEGELLSKE
jgi:hypothetical protein